MRQRLQQALIRSASTLLQQGERPEVASRARAGHVSVKANLALATASAILSGGNSAMLASKKQLYVLLTDRRLLLLESHWLTFRPVAKVLAELPRPSLAVTDVKHGFMTSFTVSVTGNPDGIQLTFARTEREEGKALLNALRGVPEA